MRIFHVIFFVAILLGCTREPTREEVRDAVRAGIQEGIRDAMESRAESPEERDCREANAIIEQWLERCKTATREESTELTRAMREYEQRKERDGYLPAAKWLKAEVLD